MKAVAAVLALPLVAAFQAPVPGALKTQLRSTAEAEEAPAAPAAPAPVAKRTTYASLPIAGETVAQDWSKAEGAVMPLGYFDPLGLLKNADQQRFDRLRYVEVKHGRIAMLAVLGHITQQNYRFPGYLSWLDQIKFSDLPNGLAAFKAMPVIASLQIFAFIGFLELLVMKNIEGTGNESPADFRNGWIAQGKKGFGWEGYTPEQKAKKRLIEINNGRAAMMGILGLMVHEQLNGRPYIINDLAGIPYTWN
ncbi:unnamed protein product [Chrysoparadoxa australica]